LLGSLFPDKVNGLQIEGVFAGMLRFSFDMDRILINDRFEGEQLLDCVSTVFSDLLGLTPCSDFEIVLSKNWRGLEGTQVLQDGRGALHSEYD
jgi:hypothetical protein